MALNPIIIPSKNIYQKDNQKVIKNLIDYVTVRQKLPQTIFDTENVYNDTFSAQGYVSGELQVDYDSQHRDIQTATPKFSYYACAYVNIQPYYVTKQITIPKRPANSIITQILSGIDNNGQTNIKYSTICTEKIDSISAKLDIYNQDGTNRKLNDIAITQGQTSLPKRTTLPKVLSQNETYDNSAGDHFNVTAEITLNDLTNIGSPDLDISDDNDNYYFTGTFYCGAVIYELKGSGIMDGASFGTGYPMQGTIATYIPVQIELSVYGNVIKLDLQDNTLTIGEGKNTYSFSGNELMQSTNTPSVENTYNKVISQYINGKEIATIRCNIDDYYTIERELDITVKSKTAIPGGTLVSLVLAPCDVYKGETLILENGINITVSYISQDTGDVNCLAYGELYEFPNINETAKVTIKSTRAISTKRIDNLPMTFHIGDVVVPYVYTAKGVDKPMSYYPDNTPKAFVVVGKGIQYRGRVYQNLTLQEVTQGGDEPFQETADIKILGSLGGGGEYETFELKLISGTLNVGDTIEYESDTGEIEEYDTDLDYYTVKLSPNGAIANSLGQTITVIVKN